MANGCKRYAQRVRWFSLGQPDIFDVYACNNIHIWIKLIVYHVYLSIYLSVCLSFFLIYSLSLSYIAYKTTSVSEAARALQQEDECPLGTMAIKFEVICSCPEGYFVCICMYKLHVWQKRKSHGERERYIYIHMYFILYMMQIFEPVWLHTSKNTHIHRNLHRRIHAQYISRWLESPWTHEAAAVSRHHGSAEGPRDPSMAQGDLAP